MKNQTGLFLAIAILLTTFQRPMAQCGIVVGDTVYVTSSNNVAGSLRFAINCVNDPASTIRFIHFNIGTPGVITITPTPAAPLPAITKANVVIDARTQPGWFLGKVVIDGAIAGNQHALQVNAANVEIYGLYITNFTNAGSGGAIVLNGSGATVSQNAMGGNRYGILANSPSSFTASDNVIGVDPTSGAARNNALDGIRILTSASGNFEITGNTIAHNVNGIFAASPVVNVLATGNEIYCNSSAGIERSGFAVSGLAITAAASTSISGSGPNGALIEVFINDAAGCDPVNPPCQGKTLIGSATVSGGTWTVSVASGVLSSGDQVTATATVGGNNTSEFLNCTTIVCDETLSFTNVKDACGAADDGEATAVVTGGGAYTYNWSNGQNTQTAVNLTAGSYTVVASDPAGCSYTGQVTISSLPVPAVGPTSNSPLCEGAALNLIANPSGGTPGYDFAWDGPSGFSSTGENPVLNSTTPADGGTYGVTVTDANGCSDRDNLTVTVNPSPDMTLTGQDADCNGAATGAIMLTTSAPPPLAFQWTNNATTQDIADLPAGNYSVTLTAGNNCQAIAGLDIHEPPVLDLNVTPANATCGQANGSATASASGGTPNYTYAWSNNAAGQINNGLAAGSYAVTATDANGCTAVETFVITNSDGPGLSTTTTDATCNGGSNGSITLTVSGGTAPLTFNWSNGDDTPNISGLPAGTYTVTVTDGNNCEAVTSATVGQPNPLTAAVTPANSLCGQDNGTAQAVAQGGAGPYTFNWSNGATGSLISGLAAGTYDLTVTDANLCTFQTSTVVADEGGPTLTADSTPADCAGTATGSISVTLTGGAGPYLFEWNTGADSQNLSNIPAGIYSLTVTDANDCQAFITATVTEPDPAVIDDLQPTPPSTVGGSDGQLAFNLSGGSPPYSYFWSGPSTGNGTLPGPGAGLIANLPAGNYTLGAIDANGCPAQNQTFTINQANCTTEITGSDITDESCAGNADGSIALTVTGGQSPFGYNWTGGGDSGSGSGLMIENLGAGSYMITVTGQDGCTDAATLTVGGNAVPPPGTTTASECDQGNGQAAFDLTALESVISTGPGFNILWFLDGAGANPVPDPQNHNAGSGQVFAAQEQGGCVSGLTAVPLQVLPQGSPGCGGGGCTTFAGTMDIGPVASFCTGGNAEANHNNDAVLDGDDALIYALHTASGTALGNVLATAPEPVFAYFAGTMTAGTTYYISAVAGNAAGGGIDLSDPCLSVAAGQPIVFSTGSGGILNFIQGEEVLCQGEMLILSTNDLGAGGFTYHWIRPSGDTVQTVEPDYILESVQPADAGDYYVFAVGQGCASDQTGPFSLTVLGLPQGEVVFAGDDANVCETSYQLEAAPVTGGNGVWTAPSGVLLQNARQASTLATGLKPGPNRFIWTVTADGCGVIGADTVNVTAATGLQAADDYFTLELANTEIFTDVLKNDGLPPGADYTLSARTLPQFGELRTLSNGFQYFEEEGLRGTVSFVYEVCYTGSDCPSACDTATVYIEVLNLPYLPEGFSPNNDGVNDNLEVLGYRSGGDVSMKLTISNRWGDLVYQSENYLEEAPWDGRSGSNSKPLPEGAYYALMEVSVEGEIYRRTQVVYLIY